MFGFSFRGNKNVKSVGQVGQQQLMNITQAKHKSRVYLSDVNSFFTLANITAQLSRALLIPANGFVGDYNSFLNDQLMNDNESDTPFDWEESMKKHFRPVIPSFIRNISISAIKSTLQSILIAVLPPQLADKLTKDCSKSLCRKLKRFESSLEVSRRIFKTFLLGNSLFAISGGIVDLIYSLFLSSRKLSNKQRVYIVARKVLLVGSCALASAAGYSLSAYPIAQSRNFLPAYIINNAPGICSGILEAACSVLVSLFIPDVK
eukprot:gene26839-35531_t